MLGEGERRALDEQGYLVLPGFMPANLLRGLRSRLLELFEEEGERAGHEFKPEPGVWRLANLVDKGNLFGSVICLPRLLVYLRHVLGPEIKLSSLNARLVPPGAGAQPLHADMGALADEKGFWVCNSIWMLDDFTLENGATRLVPGSHRWGRLPQDTLADPRAPHPEEVRATGTAGTVVVMNSHCWHAGTANRADTPRLALHAFYARRDRPQQQYQRALLRREVQEILSPELRDLLALDDPLNDALGATGSENSGFLK